MAARRAKAHAEAIALRQRGECIAFGMSTFSGQDTNAPLADVADEIPPKSVLDQALEHYLEHGELPPHMMSSPQLPTPGRAFVVGHSDDEQDTCDG